MTRRNVHENLWTVHGTQLNGDTGGIQGGFYGALPMGFKIPLGRTLLTFERKRKSVPVRHEDKLIQ